MKNFFNSILNFFSSPQAKKVAATINDLVVIATPIVQELATLVPDTKAAKASAQVIAAYQSYGVPLVHSVQEGNPVIIGDALQTLAVTKLKQALPADKADTATHILRTVIDLVVTNNKVK